MADRRKEVGLEQLLNHLFPPETDLQAPNPVQIQLLESLFQSLSDDATPTSAKGQEGPVVTGGQQRNRSDSDSEAISSGQGSRDGAVITVVRANRDRNYSPIDGNSQINPDSKYKQKKNRDQKATRSDNSEISIVEETILLRSESEEGKPVAKDIKSTKNDTESDEIQEIDPPEAPSVPQKEPGPPVVSPEDNSKKIPAFKPPTFCHSAAGYFSSRNLSYSAYEESVGVEGKCFSVRGPKFEIVADGFCPQLLRRCLDVFGFTPENVTQFKDLLRRSGVPLDKPLTNEDITPALRDGLEDSVISELLNRHLKEDPRFRQKLHVTPHLTGPPPNPSRPGFEQFEYDLSGRLITSYADVTLDPKTFGEDIFAGVTAKAKHRKNSIAVALADLSPNNQMVLLNRLNKENRTLIFTLDAVIDDCPLNISNKLVSKLKLRVAQIASDLKATEAHQKSMEEEQNRPPNKGTKRPASPPTEKGNTASGDGQNGTLEQQPPASTSKQPKKAARTEKQNLDQNSAAGGRSRSDVDRPTAAPKSSLPRRGTVFNLALLSLQNSRKVTESDWAEKSEKVKNKLWELIFEELTANHDTDLPKLIKEFAANNKNHVSFQLYETPEEETWTGCALFYADMFECTGLDEISTCWQLLKDMYGIAKLKGSLSEEIFGKFWNVGDQKATAQMKSLLRQEVKDFCRACYFSATFNLSDLWNMLDGLVAKNRDIFALDFVSQDPLSSESAYMCTLKMRLGHKDVTGCGQSKFDAFHSALATIYPADFLDSIFADILPMMVDNTAVANSSGEQQTEDLSADSELIPDDSDGKEIKEVGAGEISTTPGDDDETSTPATTVKPDPDADADEVEVLPSSSKQSTTGHTPKSAVKIASSNLNEIQDRDQPRDEPPHPDSDEPPEDLGMVHYASDVLSMQRAQAVKRAAEKEKERLDRKREGERRVAQKRKSDVAELALDGVGVGGCSSSDYGALQHNPGPRMQLEIGEIPTDIMERRSVFNSIYSFRNNSNNFFCSFLLQSENCLSLLDIAFDDAEALGALNTILNSIKMNKKTKVKKLAKKDRGKHAWFSMQDTQRQNTFRDYWHKMNNEVERDRQHVAHRPPSLWVDFLDRLNSPSFPQTPLETVLADHPQIGALKFLPIDIYPENEEWIFKLVSHVAVLEPNWSGKFVKELHKDISQILAHRRLT